MKESTLAVLRVMQMNEATDCKVYRNLAARASGANREVLLRMSSDEAQHCKVWESYTNTPSKANTLKVYFYSLLGLLFGMTFVINLLESGEDAACHNYKALLGEVPEAAAIMDDESRHEAELAEMLDEEKLKYIGSMVLGLNDALVELTGALAGFTLALGNNKTVALAGFITGVAATLSMAASEYLSKKADPTELHPLKAAIYTGIAYMITVSLLLTPYFTLESSYVALAICLVVAACVIFIFTFFVSVVRKEAFAPKFFEMLCISFSVAAVSFLIGWGAKHWMGIEM